MADVDAAARARSFGAIADAYHHHRPGYPAAALDWALEPLSGPNAATVLDLAAGTGKLTASLVDRARRVVAVEPDPEMLAVLSATLPTVTALLGSAETIPLPDACVDAVLVGQAFHWFDPEPATAEIVRVLRPGGVAALMWNGEDASVDWVRGYYEQIGRAKAASQHPQRPGLTEHPELAATDCVQFANPVPMTIEGLLANLATFSWISTLEPAERAATMTRSREYLLGRPEIGGGQFELPLRTEVLRAVRRIERR